MPQVKRSKEKTMLRFSLLACAGMIGMALWSSDGLALPGIRPAPDQPTIHTALSGNWLGDVLPPGISPFEVIRSTVTFKPDGTFNVVVETPTGSFRGAGSYSVQGHTVSLSFPSRAPVSYRLTRSGAKSNVQVLERVQPGPLVKPTPTVKNTLHPTPPPHSPQ